MVDSLSNGETPRSHCLSKQKSRGPDTLFFFLPRIARSPRKTAAARDRVLGIGFLGLISISVCGVLLKGIPAAPSISCGNSSVSSVQSVVKKSEHVVQKHDG